MDIGLNKKFISSIKGKEFVTYAGLLDVAHQKGLLGIEVDFIQLPVKENGFEAICKATAKGKNGEVFIEIADANIKNVNKMIAPHVLRMAATRAKARALRDMTNIGMTCLEELGGEEPKKQTSKKNNMDEKNNMDDLIKSDSFQKMLKAQDMYPELYEEAVTKFGEPNSIGVCDKIRDFVRHEVMKPEKSELKGIKNE